AAAHLPAALSLDFHRAAQLRLLTGTQAANHRLTPTMGHYSFPTDTNDEALFLLPIDTNDGALFLPPPH
ncbi:unnamed protein product, partial [Staurois parvus]